METLAPWAQFGLAGLFGLFAVVETREFLKSLKEQRTSSDAAVLAAQGANSQILQDQRKAFLEALSAITAEVAKLVEVTARMNELLIRHDESAEAAITTLVARERRKK